MVSLMVDKIKGSASTIIPVRFILSIACCMRPEASLSSFYIKMAIAQRDALQRTLKQLSEGR